MTDYSAILENRKVQSNGSISYDLIVKDKESGEELVNTDFTVEPRQEERDDFEDMIKRVARKQVQGIKEEKGKDHSGKKIDL